MFMFEIDGQRIRCVEAGGRRSWSCTCDDYEQRTVQYGEGFCSHTARAIMQAILAGQIRRWG